MELYITGISNFCSKTIKLRKKPWLFLEKSVTQYF